MTITQLWGHDTSDFNEANVEAVFGGLHEGPMAGVDNECEVIASSPAAMTVEIRTGTFTTGGVFGRVSAQHLLSIAAADPVDPRIDRIVLQRDNATNLVTAVVLTGTPAASPTVPTLTRTGGVWEISLAQVAVAALAVQINTADITDERRDYSVCGFAIGRDLRRSIGESAYDTFIRANSTNLGNADSGHAWLEEGGDLEIDTNSLRVVPAASASIGTLAVGEQRVADGLMDFTTAAILGDIDVGLIMRFLDTSNYLVFQLTAAEIRILKHVGGADTTVTLSAFVPTVSTRYIIEVELDGPLVLMRFYEEATTGVRTLISRAPADNLDPFVGHTKVGVRINSAPSDLVHGIAVRTRPLT